MSVNFTGCLPTFGSHYINHSGILLHHHLRSGIAAIVSNSRTLGIHLCSGVVRALFLIFPLDASDLIRAYPLCYEFLSDLLVTLSVGRLRTDIINNFIIGHRPCR